MSYFPVTPNRSGEILASGITGAAQANQQMMQGLGENIGGVIQQFAGMYAENKALDAKAGAYKEFLSKHGSQLGFDPEWIKGFAKAPRDQQLAAGDLLTGQFGQQIGRMEYLNRQAELYPRRGGSGMGGAGGGDGQKGYQVGQGWMGY